MSKQLLIYSSHLDTEWVVGRQPQDLDNVVIGLEFYVVDVAFKFVGIVLVGGDGGFPVSLVGLDRQVGSGLVSVQENHDFLDLFLS